MNKDYELIIKRLLNDVCKDIEAWEKQVATFECQANDLLNAADHRRKSIKSLTTQRNYLEQMLDGQEDQKNSEREQERGKRPLQTAER